MSFIMKITHIELNVAKNNSKTPSMLVATRRKPIE